MKKKEAPYIREYLTAAARLYGTIQLEELWIIYCQQNMSISLQQFYVQAKREERILPCAFILVGDQEFIGTKGVQTIDRIDVVDKSKVDTLWDGYLNLLESHRDLPVRVFCKTQYLAYAAPTYVPSSEGTRRLESFLNNRSLEYTGVALSQEAVCQAEQDASAVVCMRELQCMGAKFGDIEDRRKFVRLYREVYDTTPKSIHYGHTEQELRGLSLTEERIRQRIIGWWCAPYMEDLFYPTDEELMQEEFAMGCSRRQQTQYLQFLQRLPPAMMDNCYCGSGLTYEACCGAR